MCKLICFILSGVPHVSVKVGFHVCKHSERMSLLIAYVEKGRNNEK